MKVVTLDAKETLYIAGRSWANIYIYNCPITVSVGGKGHILDMNAKYKILVDFLQKAATDAEVASSLATGGQLRNSGKKEKNIPQTPERDSRKKNRDTTKKKKRPTFRKKKIQSRAHPTFYINIFKYFHSIDTIWV